jgi:hypothetical protein
VNGKPDFMGDINLKFDPKNNTLVGEMESPRDKGIWEFTVKENMMWGTLSLLPDKRIVRQIRVQKNESNERNHGKADDQDRSWQTFLRL